MNLLRNQSGGSEVYYQPRQNHDQAHPWSVSMKYNSGWQAVITPGFVDGSDPYYAPLSAGLCAEPNISLSETQDVTSIPPFFVNFGAVPPAQDASLQADANGNLALLVNQQAASGCCSGGVGRLLKSCDIWVVIARASYAVAVDMPADLVVGNLVDYTVTYNTQTLSHYGSRPRLQTGPSMPSTSSATLAERLAGDYSDDGQDYMLVATVYFLSRTQDNPDFSAKLDETWLPYVQNACFWNVSYRAANIPPVTLQQNSISPFLAWYIGQYTLAGQDVLGAMSAAEQNIYNSVFNANATMGTFYTA